MNTNYNSKNNPLNSISLFFKSDNGHYMVLALAIIYQMIAFYFFIDYYIHSGLRDGTGEGNRFLLSTYSVLFTCFIGILIFFMAVNQYRNVEIISLGILVVMGLVSHSEHISTTYSDYLATEHLSEKAFRYNKLIREILMAIALSILPEMIIYWVSDRIADRVSTLKQEDTSASSSVRNGRDRSPSPIENPQSEIENPQSEIYITTL